MNGGVSVIRHFEAQIADHLEMLSVLRREREAILERGGGDQRIQCVQTTGLGMRLHQIVGAPHDVLGRRDLLIVRNHDVEIGHFALVAGARDQFQRRDGGEHAGAANAVQVVTGLDVSTREIHDHVGVNQVRHQIAV